MKYRILCFLVGLSALSWAQEVQPFSLGGKWGYVSKDHSVIVPPSLDAAEPFFYGLARARQANSGQWGYLSPLGAWEVACEFADARDFFQSVACVKDSKSGLYHLINKRGQVLEGTAASAPIIFSEGLAPLIGTDRRFKGWLDGQGKRAISLDEDSGGKGVDHFAFREGLAACPARGLWGYMDTAGKMVIAPGFYDVQPFSEKLAAARKTKQEPWGFIGPSGDSQISPMFSDVRAFHEGKAAARAQGQWGLINRGGKFTLSPLFRSVSDCYGGYVAVARQDATSTTAILSSEGSEVFKLSSSDPFVGLWSGKFVFSGPAGTCVYESSGKQWAPASGADFVNAVLAKLSLRYDRARHRLGMVWTKDKVQMVMVFDESGKPLFRTPGDQLRFLEDGRTEVHFYLGKVPLLYYVDQTGAIYTPNS